MKSQLSSFDEKKLSELSEKYTGDGYLYFFEMLEDRKINEHQLNKYEEQMTRFSAAHKSFRNKKLEAAKNQFFDSLRDLIQFSFIHFNQYGSSHILIFRGTSEDDKKLVELGRNISKQWEGLHKIVAKLHPEFNWPDNMEVEVAD